MEPPIDFMQSGARTLGQQSSPAVGGFKHLPHLPTKVVAVDEENENNKNKNKKQEVQQLLQLQL